MGVKAAQQSETGSIIDELLAEENQSGWLGRVARQPSLNWESIVTALTERVREQIHISPPQARKLADLAMVVAEAIGSKLALAKSQRAKANVLYALDDHASAIEMHQQAATLFEAVGQNLELARTLSGSIQPLLLLGRYDEALAMGERARTIFTAQGNTWRLARLEINIGNIYQRQDRFAQALEHYERAYRELLTRDDVEGLAAALSNLSLCYISLNDFPKALEFHRKARHHCLKKGMPILVAYADYNIAYLYFLRGEYGRAIHMLRDAEQGAKAAGDLYQLALCDLDLSEIYLEVNLGNEAGELARDAHQGFERLGFGYESAKALAFAAIAASRQGQAFQGLKLFARAREMFVRNKNQVWPPLIDLYKALVLFHEGRLFEARQLAISAVEFFGGSNMGRKAALADLLLARIALRMHDPAAALEHTQAAAKRLEDLESPSLLFQAEYLFGDIGIANGDSEQAYRAYSRARQSLERLRGGLRGEELKIAFLDNKLEVYEHLVDLCLDRPGGLEEAFAYIEQAKSRSLMDRLVQPVHLRLESDSGQSELVRSIRNLREELNWYYNLIEREQLRPEENSPARIENLEQEARSREAALMRALEHATVTEVNQAGLEVPTHIALDEIRAALPSDGVLIEYFCVQDRILACILTADELKLFPVTLQSRVQKRLQLLQFQLSKFRLDPEYVRTFEESLLEATMAHLRDLYQELLGPAVRDFAHAKHLVFVPHGLVHYVP
ncbi:MAG: tetratricopeptide repeat protein, partial [Acidobacteria bacterium]|nr:tetratricopeptide repeat protein [Acidobacteriota bacterium]